MVSIGEDTFQPTISHVRAWADEHGIADEPLAELDLRLTHAIGLISASSIGDVLCFKGGTALNKLYFNNAPRISVDLDFNAVGDESVVYGRCHEVRESLIALLRQASADIHKYRYSAAGDHILFRYASVGSGGTGTFKVEISLVERFAVFGFVRQPLVVPSTSRPSERINTTVNTVAMVELIATKIRALHQRRKGRDVFDLWQAMPRIEDVAALRKLVLFHFACRNVPFDQRGFFATLDQKLRDPRFRDDLTVFLHPDTSFEWEADAAEVRRWLDTVLRLDERDEEFVLLTKHLAGTAPGRKATGIKEHVSHPLVFLFGDRPDLSNDARQFTTTDLERLMQSPRL